MNEAELKRQIVGLLQNIVIPCLENVEITYNKNIIKNVSANFGKSITRSSVAQLFILHEESAKLKELDKETITIKYFDKLFNK